MATPWGYMLLNGWGAPLFVCFALHSPRAPRGRGEANTLGLPAIHFVGLNVCLWFQRYGFLLERLGALVRGKQHEEGGGGGAGGRAPFANQPVQPEMYPILSILSRLQSNPDEESGHKETTAAFKVLLTELGGNCLLPIRILAANAMIPMVPKNQLEQEVVARLGVVAGFRGPVSADAGTKRADLNQNTLHGALLCASMLLAQWLTAPTNVDAVADAVAGLAWLLDLGNHRVSDSVAASYLDMCNRLLALQGTGAGEDTRALAVVAASLGPALAVCDHHRIGNTLLRNACVDVMWTACRRPGGREADGALVALLRSGRIDLVLHVLRTLLDDPRRETQGNPPPPSSGGSGREMVRDPAVLRGLNEAVVQLVMSRAFAPVEQSHYLPLALEVLLMLHGAGRATAFPVPTDHGATSFVAFAREVASFKGRFKNQRLEEACVAVGGCCMAPEDVAGRGDAHNAPGALFQQWAEQVARGACYDAPSSMRMACARGILGAVPFVFGTQATAAHGTPVLQALISLLQDEDDAIRAVAATTASAILRHEGRRAPAGAGLSLQPFWSLQSNLAVGYCYCKLQRGLEEQLFQIGQTPYVAAWSTLVGMLGGGGEGPGAAGGAAAGEGPSALFVKEDPNTFVEPAINAQHALAAILRFVNQRDGVVDTSYDPGNAPCEWLSADHVRTTLAREAHGLANACCVRITAGLRAAEADRHGASGTGVDGRNEPLLRLYRSLLSLAALVYTLGACSSVEGMQPAKASQAQLQQDLPLLRPLLEDLCDAVADGVLPVLCQQAAVCLKRAIGAWTLPEHKAGARAYAALIAAQVASLATTGPASMSTDSFFQIAGEAEEVSEGFGDDVGAWYRDDINRILVCPFGDAIPWNFLSGT